MRKRVAVIEGRRVGDFVAADARKPSTRQSKLSPPVASVKVAEELFSTSPLGTGGLGPYLALVLSVGLLYPLDRRLHIHGRLLPRAIATLGPGHKCPVAPGQSYPGARAPMPTGVLLIPQKRPL